MLSKWHLCLLFSINDCYTHTHRVIQQCTIKPASTLLKKATILANLLAFILKPRDELAIFLLYVWIEEAKKCVPTYTNNQWDLVCLRFSLHLTDIIGLLLLDLLHIALSCVLSLSQMFPRMFKPEFTQVNSTFHLVTWRLLWNGVRKWGGKSDNVAKLYVNTL